MGETGVSLLPVPSDLPIMRHIDCKIATDLNLFYRNLPEEMGHSVNYVIASITVWALEPFTDPWLIVERRSTRTRQVIGIIILSVHLSARMKAAQRANHH